MINFGFLGKSVEKLEKLYPSFDLAIRTKSFSSPDFNGFKGNSEHHIHLENTKTKQSRDFKFKVNGFPQNCGSTILHNFTFPIDVTSEEVNFVFEEAAANFAGNTFFILVKSHKYTSNGQSTGEYGWLLPYYALLEKKGKLVSQWYNPIYGHGHINLLYEYRLPGSTAETKIDG